MAVYSNSPSGYGGYPFWIHAVRLATGRDVIVARGESGPWLRVAAIEAPGLVYARDIHSLAFVPLARAPAAVGMDGAASRS